MHIAGRVNSGNAFELHDRLNSLVEAGCKAIVVDLTRLDHMTSAGFRSLLRVEKRVMDIDGRMVLCGVHGLTLELFQAGGFLDMLAVTKTREEAILQAARTEAAKET